MYNNFYTIKRKIYLIIQQRLSYLGPSVYYDFLLSCKENVERLLNDKNHHQYTKNSLSGWEMLKQFFRIVDVINHSNDLEISFACLLTS